jgi:hypothetical protein
MLIFSGHISGQVEVQITAHLWNEDTSMLACLKFRELNQHVWSET